MRKLITLACAAVLAAAVLAAPAQAHNGNHHDCTSTDVNLNYWLMQGDNGSDWCPDGHETSDPHNGADHMYGYDGSDLLRAWGGPDEVHGGAGNDDLSGGGGNDLLRDDSTGDTDTFCDGNGTDWVDAKDGDGKDTLYMWDDGISNEFEKDTGDNVVHNSSCV